MLQHGACYTRLPAAVKFSAEGDQICCQPQVRLSSFAAAGWPVPCMCHCIAGQPVSALLSKIPLTDCSAERLGCFAHRCTCTYRPAWSNMLDPAHRGQHGQARFILHVLVAHELHTGCCSPLATVHKGVQHVAAVAACRGSPPAKRKATPSKAPAKRPSSAGKKEKAAKAAPAKRKREASVGTCRGPHSCGWQSLEDSA